MRDHCDAVVDTDDVLRYLIQTQPKKLLLKVSFGDNHKFDPSKLEVITSEVNMFLPILFLFYAQNHFSFKGR